MLDPNVLKLQELASKMNITRQGRKPLEPHQRKVLISLALPGWMLVFMDTLPGNRSQIIEAALYSTYQITLAEVAEYKALHEASYKGK